MDAALLRPAELPAKDRGNGIATTALVTSSRGARAMLTGITVIPSGSSVPLHFHNCEETVIVLSGRGFVHVDGIERPVAPRDTSWIPPDVPHCFRNPKGEVPLEIYWAYASVDATRTIVATGVTTRIDEE
jgi:putative monooxygenase